MQLQKYCNLDKLTSEKFLSAFIFYLLYNNKYINKSQMFNLILLNNSLIMVVKERHLKPLCSLLADKPIHQYLES